MKFKTRAIWLFLILLAYSVWAVIPVSAHALLVRSVPEANAVLEDSPAQVELYFSEPLEQELSSITAYDSNNLIVDAGDVRVDPSDPTRMTVSLRSLEDGVYTVTWKAVSSIDGHQTVGTFPFAVGDANTNAVNDIRQSSTAKLPFSALLSKFLMLASLALLVGQSLFISLIWEPALKSDQGVGQPSIWQTLYRVGLGGLLLSIGIGILSQAGQTTGNELSLPWNPEVGKILTETRLGVIWLVRLALAIFAVWLTSGNKTSIKKWTGFIVNVVLLFTVTLTSHAATEAKPLLPILGDLLHLLGMTFWLGGLVYLFTGIRRLQGLDDAQPTKLTYLVTSRFSFNAIIFVGLIGVTGLYSATLRVGIWSALLTSLYGHVLLVKQAFVGGLLVIAAINLLVISPRLKRERTQGTPTTNVAAHFGKMLILEMTFAGLLLASVTFLTYLPPARTLSPDTDFISSKDVDGLIVEIYISPARVGQNEFMLMLVENGKPVDTVREVLLRFTPSQGNIPPSELQLLSDGAGMFSAKGKNLSLPNDWQVQAVVRRKDKFDAYANFDLKLKKTGASDSANASFLIGSLLLLIGLFTALTTYSANTNRVIRLGLGIPLAVLTTGFGFYYLTNPPSATGNLQANPIPANNESITAGTELYTTYCAPCHGITGKGDGPVGVTLNPRPADLTVHAIPGVHTDAQLYEWITNGFPGSRMPAFGSKLSDTDRWNLVNFIRTLAPEE